MEGPFGFKVLLQIHFLLSFTSDWKQVKISYILVMPDILDINLLRFDLLLLHHAFIFVIPETTLNTHSHLCVP